MTARAVVHGTIDTPGPCVALLTWSDAAGRILGRRRSHDRTYRLSLPPGRYRIDVEDDRALGYTRRHGASHVLVDVGAGERLEQPLLLQPVPVLRGVVEVNGAPERHARVHVQHEDGRRWLLRTDGHGRFLAAGLPAGPLTLTAYDARRGACSAPVRVPAERPDAVIRVDTQTAAVAVRLTLPSGAAAPEARGHLVDAATGEPHPITVRGGLGAAAGLAPGDYELVLPPSSGLLGGTFTLGRVSAGDMVVHDLVVGLSAVVTGRVVDGATGLGLLAAPVVLLDAEGTELERVRTDREGAFVLGRDLRSVGELTVVVTGGPERRHVQQVAVADVEVRAGCRHDLGAIVVPPSCAAHWSPHHRASGLTSPTTRA